jgi:capsular polysaccharide biosynthesis protein
MGDNINQNISEYVVLGLDILRRRWLVFLLPIVLAVPLAALAIKFAPTKYVAKSLILLQSANRAANTGGFGRQNLVEQVAAIDAWLKSDHVLRDLLPQIMGAESSTDPKAVSSMIRQARSSIWLSLIGGSALEVSFVGSSPEGLSRKLEVVLARIMEGLTGPENGIFNASQFLLIQRGEASRVAEEGLDEAIRRAGAQNPDLVRSQLQRLYDADQRPRSRFAADPKSSAKTGSEPELGGTQQETVPETSEAEQAIFADPQVVKELRRYFDGFQQAQLEYQALKDRLSSRQGNYVGIFDSAENVLVVGRPQDPIFGESAARKLAIAIVFLSIICGFGLVWLVEMLCSRLRTRNEFESLSGLPVVARLQKLAR